MFYRLKQLTLLLGDLLMLYLGLFSGNALRYWNWSIDNTLALLPPLSALFALVVIILFIVGLYDVGRAKNSWNFYQKIITSAGIWLVLAVLFFYIRADTITPKTTLLLIALSGFSFIALWRYTYNRFLSTVILKTTIIFAGQSPASIELATLFLLEPERGFALAGFILEPNEQLPENLRTVPRDPKLSELIKKNNYYPGLVVLTPEAAANPGLSRELYQILFNQVSITGLTEFYEQICKRIPPFTFSESWFITHLQEQKRKIYDRFRILVDFGIALLMGLIFAVTFPCIALAIKSTSRGPIFFRQKRVGRLGQPFAMWKYRTMRSLAKDGSAETQGPAYAQKNDQRITAVGTFLRRTRLDELPQFFNILRGDMGLIGPRPERPEFVEQLTAKIPFYPLRHLIKPGLAGWAQLQESYYGTIEENLFKLEYDLYYVKNRSFLLDIAILLRTINVVLKMVGR